MAENLHPDIPDSQLHNPKGFAGAGNATFIFKDEKAALVWETRQRLPAALQFVDQTAAPPTEASGDIYVLDGESTAVDAAWDGLAQHDWARYDGTTWLGITPVEPTFCWDKSEDEDRIFTNDWDKDKPNDVLTNKITLSSAQLLNIFTSPVTIIPAPGAGKAINILSVAASLNFNSVAYTGGEILSILETDGSGNSWTSLTSGITTLLDEAANRYLFKNPTPNFFSAINSPIVVTTGVGNPATGDSTVTIEIVYRITNFN